jgi:3-(3-hydroxy-phenyl)propionate hydroxylase
MAANDDRVIISGCGPVGAVMTLALVKQGIPVTLIEQLPDAAEDQRAATIHPPTVDMLVKLGLEKEMFSTEPTGGMEAPLFHFRDRATGKLIAVFDISLLKGEVPYPYVLQWEQYKLVHAALPHIKASGLGEVRFSTKLTGLAQTADHVEATATNAAGESETLRGKYLIGADGGSSTVRRLADIAFEGFTWPERFIKIGTSFDFGTTGQGYCTRNYFSDPDEWINLFKVKGKGPPGIWRGVFPVPEQETDEAALSMAGIQRRLQGIHERSGEYEIPYYALYAVHQRVAATFNKGRVLLAGDCAHVNNPIGGMGMNGGIHDGINLAGKLASVIHGEAGDELLDLYSRQRRHAAVKYVQAQTIANKRLMEERDAAIRAKNFDELRRTAENPETAKAYMRRAALADSLRDAAAVT